MYQGSAASPVSDGAATPARAELESRQIAGQPVERTARSHKLTCRHREPRDEGQPFGLAELEHRFCGAL
jgi:hypothetical protein